MNNYNNCFEIYNDNSKELFGLTYFGQKQYELTIPKEVKKIGPHAFKGATDSLSSIIFAKNSQLEIIDKDAFTFAKDARYGLRFYVYDEKIKQLLLSIGIEDYNIYFIVDEYFIVQKGDINRLVGLTEEGTKQTHLTIPSFINLLDPSGLNKNKLHDCGQWKPQLCSDLKSITLPNNIKFIPDIFFRNCLSLESITIPKSVTKIGDRAFEYCPKLTSVTFEEGSKLHSIGPGSFQDCLSLQSITIPKSVISIGCGAFQGCDKLTSVINHSTVLFDWWVENHEYDLQDGSKQTLSQMSNIDLNNFTNSDGQQFTKIAPSAFYDQNVLEEIIIANSIQLIADSAFMNCSFLNAVRFNYLSQLQEIESNAFLNCKSLVYFGAPPLLKEIGCDAFYNTALKQKPFVTESIDEGE